MVKPKEQLQLPTEGEIKIDVFQKKEVRKVHHKGEWWFSLLDILEALTDEPNSGEYLTKLRAEDTELFLALDALSLSLDVPDQAGIITKQECINIEGIFRLIQSVSSPKADRFKKWLARVGFERLEEIRDPELAVKRAIAIYKAKGYQDEWIDARIRSKVSREELTREWNNRGMQDYIGLLTDAISTQTFGMKTKDHMKYKGLVSQNLRDHMTPIELTLMTLGELSTTKIVTATNPQSLTQHMNAAKKGGSIAGQARRSIEEATKKSIVSSENYLTLKQRQKNVEKLEAEHIENLFNTALPSSNSVHQVTLALRSDLSKLDLDSLKSYISGIDGSIKLIFIIPGNPRRYVEYKRGIIFNETVSQELQRFGRIETE